MSEQIFGGGYGPGIESRLRRYYIKKYGKPYWKENRNRILADVLNRTGVNTTRTAKYTSRERRMMRRSPWQYPQWALEDAQIPESYWRQWFDPEALAPIWQFVQWLLAGGSLA